MNTRFTVALLSCLAATTIGFAGHHEKNPTLKALLNSYNSANDKVVSLAEAIPEDKYDWRPAEGIRSVQQCVGHVQIAHQRIEQRNVTNGVDCPGIRSAE